MIPWWKRSYAESSGCFCISIKLLFTLPKNFPWEPKDQDKMVVLVTLFFVMSQFDKFFFVFHRFFKLRFCTPIFIVLSPLIFCPYRRAAIMYSLLAWHIIFGHPTVLAIERETAIFVLLSFFSQPVHTPVYNIVFCVSQLDKLYIFCFPWIFYTNILSSDCYRIDCYCYWHSAPYRRAAVMNSS